MAARHKSWLKSATAKAAAGFPIEWSQTMRKARVISAQSTGTTSRKGLAFHI
jgi:hypothetical protein